MFSYKFYSRAERNNEVVLRISNNRKKAEVSLGFQMTQPQLDDALSERPRPENVNWHSLLSLYRTKIDDIKCELMKAGRGGADAKEIRALVVSACLNRETTIGAGGTFTAHFRRFMELKANPATKEVYAHTLRRIMLFDSEADLRRFEDIDFGWLERFEAFCARTASKNARNIHLRNIRAVFNNAIDNELTNAYPFRRFKIRPEATEKRALTVEELRSVIVYPVEPYAEIYRDMFALIFMLIGINTVDLHRLTGIENGRVNFRRAKTGRLYSIKVEPEAQAIIDKYRGERGLLCIADRWRDHRNFRHQLNEALQRMGHVERRGRGGRKIIDAAFPGLTSYWARHTWATIAADLDIPDAIISQALGHSGANSTTEIYIKRNLRKIDVANRRVLDYVLHGIGGPEY